MLSIINFWNCLIAVSLISAIQCVIFLFLTKGITYFGKDTDNSKQVASAAQSPKWRWPSDMHKYSGGKSRMKDIVVILLAFMQRLTFDKKSDYPLVALCAATNSISSVLLFLIACKYFGLPIALVVYLFFIFSAWPWQNALMGFHISTAQMFFLLTVLCIQMPWYLASGAVFGLMQFSSASSRKFNVFVVAAIAYSQVRFFAFPVMNGLSGLASWIFLAAALICLTANAFIKTKGRFFKIMSLLIKSTAYSSLYCAVYILCFGLRALISSHVPFVLGFACAVLLLLLPNVKKNLASFFEYWDLASSLGHFRLYRTYFAKTGKPISDDMRGAGWIWVYRYYGRISLFTFGSSFLGVLAVMFKAFNGGNALYGLGELLLIVLLSASPVIWGEVTRGPQIGRSYYPGFYGQLLVIAYSLAKIGVSFGHPRIVVPLILVLTVHAVWNYSIFFGDLYPSRMAAAWLAKKIKALNVKQIYTYDTPYNDSLLGVVKPEDLKEVKINYIKSIDEVLSGPGEEDSAVVVPGTSSKSLVMESHEEAFTDRDFRSDPALNKLIDSRRIRDAALACFKTFGTSKNWINESEVPSYRYLILKEISDEDRWRGHAWILSVAKLRKVAC
ncbi:MAG: hypothetical protein WC490_01195 [Candidatus Margulisiibacteriota bacterium]